MKLASCNQIHTHSPSTLHLHLWITHGGMLCSDSSCQLYLILLQEFYYILLSKNQTFLLIRALMLGKTLPPSWFCFLFTSEAACSGLLRAPWWRRWGWWGSCSPHTSGAEGSDQQVPGDGGRWRMLNCCLTKLDWLEHVWLAARREVGSSQRRWN